MSDLTKKALGASLKKILLQKPLEKITITDLTNDCGVNRQTFYLKYNSLPFTVSYHAYARRCGGVLTIKCNS